MAKHIPLLIIGAGPYGLVMSAYARRCRIDHVVVGKTMDFWKSNMPQGMYLRSMCDWHYDPFNEDTIERYLETRNLKTADFEPLSLDFYLEYCEWFQKQKAIEVLLAWVSQLNYAHDTSPFFEAHLEGGRTVTAKNVVLALGFRYFKNVPEPYPTLFPPERFAHTSDFVDFSRLRGKRVLIIGGRQSAFEWAALINEQGAEGVYLSYRHPTPAFQPSDWAWVNPVVNSMVTDPGWFRRLTAERQEEVDHRLWVKGRSKLEPWLASRIAQGGIKLFPQSMVTSGRELSDGKVEVRLDNGTTVAVDKIVLATGYRVNVSQIPLLANGNILAQLEARNGFPLLDEHFQSSIPGFVLNQYVRGPGLWAILCVYGRGARVGPINRIGFGHVMHRQ